MTLEEWGYSFPCQCRDNEVNNEEAESAHHKSDDSPPQGSFSGTRISPGGFSEHDLVAADENENKEYSSREAEDHFNHFSDEFRDTVCRNVPFAQFTGTSPFGNETADITRSVSGHCQQKKENAHDHTHSETYCAAEGAVRAID